MTPCIVCAPDLVLVPFAERHLTERYCAWLNDRTLMRHSRQAATHHDLTSCRRYWQERLAAGDPFWALEWRQGHVGNLTAYLNRRDGSANLAILLGAVEARGRGFGRAAFEAAADWLLGPGGVSQVNAGTQPENLAMRAILERAPWRALPEKDGALRFQRARPESDFRARQALKQSSGV